MLVDPEITGGAGGGRGTKVIWASGRGDGVGDEGGDWIKVRVFVS